MCGQTAQPEERLHDPTARLGKEAGATPSVASSPDKGEPSPVVSPNSRSGSETRQRRFRPSMRCTSGELAQLEAAAERAGLTVGAFMRGQCLGTPGPRAVRRPPVERVALAQLLAWLGRCSGNLNQLTKIANTTGDIPPGVAEAIGEVRAAAREVMQVLGRRDV